MAGKPDFSLNEAAEADVQDAWRRRVGSDAADIGESVLFKPR
jgi:hypothetical protein